MQNNAFFTHSGLLGVLFIVGCSTKVDEPTAQQGSPLVGQTLVSMSASAPARSADDVKQKTAALLSLFGENIAISTEDIALAPISAKTRALAAAQKLPSVRVQYDASNDTFEATDVELARVRDGASVSEEEARGEFDKVAAKLISSGVMQASDYDLNDVRVSRMVQGIGHSSGGAPTETTKEYRFFAPRKINGVVLADAGQRELGLRIAIHKSGMLKGVKASAIGVLVAKGKSAVVRSVDQATLDRRVAAEFPDSTVTSLGTRYTLGTKGLSEPRQAYQVSRRSVIDGQVINSRAQVVSYSVADRSAPPQTWPTPNPGDVSSQPYAKIKPF